MIRDGTNAVTGWSLSSTSGSSMPVTIYGSDTFTTGSTATATATATAAATFGGTATDTATDGNSDSMDIDEDSSSGNGNASSEHNSAVHSFIAHKTSSTTSA
jgi:hypothetical protein